MSETELIYRTHIFTGMSEEVWAGSREHVGLHLHWSRANSTHLESISQHLGQEEAPSPSSARGTDSALEEVRPHLTAHGSSQPQVAHMQAECDFYNHI